MIRTKVFWELGMKQESPELDGQERMAPSDLFIRNVCTRMPATACICCTSMSPYRLGNPILQGTVLPSLFYFNLHCGHVLAFGLSKSGRLEDSGSDLFHTVRRLFYVHQNH